MNQQDYQSLWEETIKSLKKELSDFEISSWIKLLHYKSSQKGKIIIAVDSNFHRDQIKLKYLNRIEKIFFDLTTEKITLQIDVDSSISNDDDDEEEIKNYNKESSKVEKLDIYPDLNENYTFDNFVIGSGNTFVANAALAIAKNPTVSSYNPFFIYGGVGLGKTHLLQAIAIYIWKNTKLKVSYVTAETFVSEFIQALRSPDKSGVPLSSFKKKYRNTDVLLIDDVQLLEGKIESQEEIHNTFNTLYLNKKQIVFASDRPPSELKLQDRLKSRFKSGVVADIKMPDYETRYAILTKKNETSNVKIDSSIIDFIAQNVLSSVRDLEAMLKKSVAYVECTGKFLNLETAKKLLIGDIKAQTQVSVDIDTIIKLVADYFNVSQEDIKSKKRSKTIVFPRHIAIYLVREMTEYSSTEIGHAFGGKDHSAILSACKKIEERIICEPSIQTVISTLQEKIREKNNL